MTALNLIQAQCTAKRGELILFEALRDLVGMEDAPVLPIAIRSAERRTRGNVISFTDRGVKR